MHVLDTTSNCMLARLTSNQGNAHVLHCLSLYCLCCFCPCCCS
jgi:hypothetical protein